MTTLGHRHTTPCIAFLALDLSKSAVPNIYMLGCQLGAGHALDTAEPDHFAQLRHNGRTLTLLWDWEEDEPATQLKKADEEQAAVTPDDPAARNLRVQEFMENQCKIYGHGDNCKFQEHGVFCVCTCHLFKKGEKRSYNGVLLSKEEVVSWCEDLGHADACTVPGLCPCPCHSPLMSTASVPGRCVGFPPLPYGIP